MQKRYFSVEEVNAMIPEVEQALTRMIQVQSQIRRLHERLQALGAIPEDGQDPADRADHGPREQMDLATFEALVEALREDLESLRRRGAMVKDLDTGLVDWFAHREGDDVLLCWKLGESEVEWWHTLEDGFAGRRPISEF